MEEQEKPRIIATKKDVDEFFYNEPYPAFLDILGFKALVKKNSHEKLVGLLAKRNENSN